MPFVPPGHNLTLPKLYQNFTEFDQFFIYRHALNQTHVAPNGAWTVFRGSWSIDMALLTDLSRILIPLETAENRRVRRSTDVDGALEPRCLPPRAPEGTKGYQKVPEFEFCGVAGANRHSFIISLSPWGGGGIRPYPGTDTPRQQPVFQLNRYRRALTRSPLSPAQRARPGKTGGYFTPRGMIFAGQSDATPPR